MDGIQWLADLPHVNDFGYYLVFAKGIDENEFIRRAGGDPQSSATATLGQSFEDEGQEDIVRVGHAAGWAYAVAPGYSQIPSERESALSAGGVDVVVLSDNGNAVCIFIHLRDGSSLCGFEPGSAQHRSGEEPDSWVPALKQVGLLTPDGGSPMTGAEVDIHPGRLMLRMAEETCGLEVPRHDYEGPLRALRVPRL